MVKNYHSEFELEMNPQQTRQLRSQADVLLRHLMAGREQSERRLAELGQRDAMKFVTGRTAIEDAIATTRCMIRDMDALLQEMSDDLDDADADAQHELLAMGTAR